MSRNAHIGAVSDPNLVDERLWALLGTSPPTEIGVFPILLTDEVAALLYTQTQDTVDAHTAGSLADLATAITSGFQRLLKAAQR